MIKWHKEHVGIFQSLLLTCLQLQTCPTNEILEAHLLKVIQWLRGHNFALFWPPLSSTWTFLTLNMDKNMHFLDHLPPLLVHVVIERPLCVINWKMQYVLFRDLKVPVCPRTYLAVFYKRKTSKEKFCN